MFYQLFPVFFFLFSWVFLKSPAQPHQSTTRPLERAASTSKWYALLVYSMGKCKQINNSNLPYVSDVISLMICERNYVFHWCRASYLKSVAIPSQHCMKSRYKSRTIIWWFMVNDAMTWRKHAVNKISMLYT